MKRYFPEICKQMGAEYGINPLLLEALIKKESGGDRWAIRYESHWKWFLHPIKYARLLLITEKTERILQACSLGPAQVMGAVARELGHVGPIPQLFDPHLGIKYGAMKLSQLLEKHGNALDALSAYNTGKPARKTRTGRNYADAVLGYLDQLITANNRGT